MDFRGGALFHNTFVRYLFAIALVASTFALRLWLTPLTGTGASFVLFFAAVLVISVAAGIGPGISAIVLSVPLEAYMFATRAGYPSFQVAGQGLLFAVDGLIAVYLTFLMKKERQAAQDANRQLREANEQITSSMTRTREVIELSPDAVFQANLDGRFTDVNQAACRLLGYDRDELLGNTIFEMIPVEDRSRLKAVRAELLVPGHVHRAEWSLKRKDGTFVPVEVSAHILPDSRWQAFVRDISERKRIEQELKAANASLDAIIENIPLVLFLKDAKSLRYLRLNRAGEDLLGWPKETFIGKNDYQLWPQTQAELFVEKDRETLKDKMIDIAEEPIQTHYQGVRLLHTKKVPILDAAGQPMYLLGISEDITERRRIEKEQQFLAEVNVTLSASIDYERTLATLVRLLVQDIADWSAIDVMDERGQLTRLKVACADPAKAGSRAPTPPRRRFARISSSFRPIEISLTSCGLWLRAGGPSSSSRLRHSTSRRLRRGRDTCKHS